MKRIIFLLAVLALFVIPLSVLAQEGGTDAVVRAVESDITTLNPILYTDGGSFAAARHLWPTLYDVDPLTGLPIPGLTSWEISEDGLTYTFTFREDAVWSDGTPITANDFKFTYDAIAAENVESPRKDAVELIESITVPDDRTAVVQLKEVNCTIWGDLGLGLMPAHRFAADFSDVMTNPLNTEPDISGGPYILEEWQPDEFQRYVANETFWRGAPQIPVLIQRPIQDPAIEIQAVLAQEVDYAFMYPDEAAQAQADYLVHYAFPNFNTPFFAFNWADPNNPQPAYDEDGNPVEQAPHPIFSDVRVRQAIAMGYDKDAVVATLGDGGGFRLLSTVLPTIDWAFNSDVEPYQYDPEAAAALLDEAGWVMNEETGIREKDGVPLSFTISVSPLVDLWENMALIAQDQLGELGMEINVETLEWGTFLNDTLLSQKFDALVVGFGGGTPPDPDAITGNILPSQNDVPGSGFNMTSYVNPEVDALIEQGKSVPGCSLEERAPIYKEIQRIANEDVAYDFSTGVNAVNIYNARVQDIAPGPWSVDSIWNIEQWTIGE